MPALPPEKISELDDFLLELNAAAAEAIAPYFRAEYGMVDKGGAKGFDPVTEADKAAERAIRKLIGQRYPDHGVVGEEFGEDRPDAEFVWITDPVDGTRAFISGLPLWCTLIGLRVEGRQVLGSIAQPYLGEVFLGSPSGSRLVARGETRPLRVRPCPKLTDALIATTDPEACFDGAELGAWRQVRSAARLARLGCDAYAYAMVAAGQMDLVIEAGLAPWDVAGLAPLIENAGGIVTDWRGAPMPERGGQIAIAGDRACLDEALVALRRSAK